MTSSIESGFSEALIFAISGMIASVMLLNDYHNDLINAMLRTIWFVISVLGIIETIRNIRIRKFTFAVGYLIGLFIMMKAGILF